MGFRAPYEGVQGLLSPHLKVINLSIAIVPIGSIPSFEGLQCLLRLDINRHVNHAMVA